VVVVLGKVETVLICSCSRVAMTTTCIEQRSSKARSRLRQVTAIDKMAIIRKADDWRVA
jgi:hypothetical protein